MPFFGPRLDRPSGVGDEGRPRASSLTVAGLVVAGLATAAGYAIGRPGLLPGFGVAIALTVAGAALLGRNDLGPTVVGHVCFTPAAAALLAVVAVSAALTEYGLVVAGFAAAALGVAAAWTDVLTADHLRSVLDQTATAFVATLAGLVALSVVVALVWALAGLLGTFVAGVGPTASAVGFLAIVAAAALAVWVALRRVPVVRLAPRSRRPAFGARVRRGRRAAAVVGTLATVLAVVAVVSWSTGNLAGLYAGVPGIGGLFALLSNPPVVGPVVAVGAAAVLATVVTWAGERLARRDDRASAERVAASVAGLVLAVLLVPAVFGAAAIAGEIGSLVVVGLVVAGPVCVLIVGHVAVAAMEAGFVPDRAAAPALAGAGLFVATLGAGLSGLAGPLVFACAAGSLVVWDVSSFGLGVTAELGHRPETRRLELFHAVAAVGVGVAAVAVVTVLDLARGSLGDALAVTPAAVLAVVGVVVLLALLRG